MLIGYVRVSKADGSQALDLQMDALIELQALWQAALVPVAEERADPSVRF